LADTFLTDPLQVVTKNNLQFNMSSKYKDRLVELYFHKIYSAEHNPIICIIFVHIGVNMKKWCILQSRIKSGATDEVRNTTLDMVSELKNMYRQHEGSLIFHSSVKQENGRTII